MYIKRAGVSSVVRLKMCNIPRPAGLFLRRALVLVVSNIYKVILPVVHILADRKVSFPRWG